MISTHTRQDRQNNEEGSGREVLTVTGTNPPASTDFFYLAVFGSNLYYASQVSGTIYLVER